MILKDHLLSCVDNESFQRNENKNLIYVCVIVCVRVQVVDEIMAVLKEDKPRLPQLQENASSLAQLSTQTVFSMLDHLTQWGRCRLQTLSTAKSSGRQNRDTQDLHASGDKTHTHTLHDRLYIQMHFKNFLDSDWSEGGGSVRCIRV